MLGKLKYKIRNNCIIGNVRSRSVKKYWLKKFSHLSKAEKRRLTYNKENILFYLETKGYKDYVRN